MKKTFRMMLLLAMMMAACVSMGSCSSSDDDGTFSEQRVEEYITGYKWYLDHNKRSEFRFYRNRLVTCMSGSGSITSGSLTWAESNFFGTWAVADGKLVTTFTTGAYEGFDWNSILYGSLTINKIQKDYHEIETTAPNGDAHSLGSYMVSYGKSNDFVDYSDNSDHDGALVGTWEALAHDDKHNIIFTIKIGKKGKITFIAKSENIDFTTTCTTKNGHVTFSHLFEPGNNSRSFIYIREKNKIRFYSEENAQQVWVWDKVE